MKPRQSLSTRRAFLFGVGALSGGLAIGYGGALLAGRPAAASATALPERFQWADDLGMSQPDRDLLDSLPPFVGVVHEACEALADTAGMWRGVERAVELVIADREQPLRRIRARMLLTLAEQRPRCFGKATIASLTEALAGK